MNKNIVKELMRDGHTRAYYTTRGEGKRESAYDGFNICHYTGDCETHVEECRKALATEFGVDEECILVPRQTHSTNVAVVTSMPVQSHNIDNVDAIVTDLSGVIIGVNTADCVPVILSDSSNGIIAAAHAGWRGAIGGIIENTLASMITLGAEIQNIKVAMGPSICQNCFEVGQEVAEKFEDGCVDYHSWDKPHVSIHKHIVKVLTEHGVSKENIKGFDDALCTKCHPETFFSARKLGINSGRVYTFVMQLT